MTIPCPVLRAAEKPNAILLESCILPLVSRRKNARGIAGLAVAVDKIRHSVYPEVIIASGFSFYGLGGASL